MQRENDHEEDSYDSPSFNLFVCLCSAIGAVLLPLGVKLAFPQYFKHETVSHVAIAESSTYLNVGSLVNQPNGGYLSGNVPVGITAQNNQGVSLSQESLNERPSAVGHGVDSVGNFHQSGVLFYSGAPTLNGELCENTNGSPKESPQK